jgi:hypothetical protein
MRTKKAPLLAVVAGAFVVATSVLLLACDGSDGAVKERAPTPDSGKLADGAPIPTPDGGLLPDGALPDGDCFPSPKTHFEIINACTDAAKIDKSPTLPLLLADGGLPPLP